MINRNAEPKPIPRRRFLKAALAGAFIVGGAIAVRVRTSGYALGPKERAELRALAPWQFIFVEHVARRIAAPDRADDASIPSTDDVGVAPFVDRYVEKMPSTLRRDLMRAFAYVEHMAPLGLGMTSRFTHLDPADQDRVLASLESSSIMLLRGAFEGIKSLIFMGFYRDPRTWKILGYAGPRVNRPALGWWK